MSIDFSAELMSVGASALEFKAWDKYHVDSPSSVYIEFYFVSNKSIQI